MLSPEGERIVLGKGLKARGNVEDWLGKVEQAMFASLKREMKKGIIDLDAKGRREFIRVYPSQVLPLFNIRKNDIVLFVKLVTINLIYTGGQLIYHIFFLLSRLF